MKINYPTSNPPSTAEEHTPPQRSVALELLRCINEDWEFIGESEKKERVEDAIAVLDNE